jgi:hypothetical protein
MLALMPAAAFAETDDQAGGGTVRMIAGEMLSGFEGYTSKDPSVAWVDESGRLCAMKEGETTITTGTESGTFTRRVSVSRYDDGSPVVGRLKILARYNDQMQFYDGHAYLLFTSYRDGVKISVDDLYAGYEISDRYYKDIRENISAGSNHTGNDADKYFTYRNDMSSVTLDRGEIVTIGMYRDFDLTVPQAALGSLQNSSLWGGLRREGKTAAIENIFSLVDSRQISFEEAINRCKALIKEAGLDYKKWTDGVVNGGVCFNRELYNQKLEWDQFENVTYDLDITQKQLDALVSTLGGNGNKFSIMHNSCATIAVNAWNAAVGIRNGEDTSYKLYKNGKGIFSDFDAPRTVRESIMDRLPGYYLNNSAGVQEPDAGFRDDTGWVYVSAPSKVDSDIHIYEKYDLDTFVTSADDLNMKTEIYTLGEGGKHEPVGSNASFSEGKEIFVKVNAGEGGDFRYALKDITMNGISFWDEEHFDHDEQAYVVRMPAKKSSRLRVLYAKTELTPADSTFVQIPKGETLDITDYASLSSGSKRMKWEIIPDGDVLDSNDVLTYTDESRTKLKAVAPGAADVWAYAEGNDEIRLLFHVNIYRSRDKMAAVSFDDSGDIRVAVIDSSGEVAGYLPQSGYLEPKGTEFELIPFWSESKVLSSVTAGGRSIGPEEKFKADKDISISYKTRAASVTGVPDRITLSKKGDSYQLKAKTRYDGLLAGLLPVYDSSITYLSSSSLVSVSDDGLIKVAGDVPEGGMAVYVYAIAGSSGGKVLAPCKVVIGDYDGERTVARLTIHARTVSAEESTPHSAVTITAKEDLDLGISYFEYYKPNAKLIGLLEDYNEHPDKYAHDPALYNNNELDIKDRLSYFDITRNGSFSEPEDITLGKDTSISLSSYSFTPSDLTAMRLAFENGEIYSSEDTAELVRQIYAYQGGSEDFDPEKAFDSFASTVAQIYRTSKQYGYIPADGATEGGLCIDREMFNQFRSNNTQLHNNYYSVDLTAEEFAELSAYLADPSNNYYSLFSKNCGSSARDMWNAALFDRPELRLKANYSTISDEPESLYVELGLLRLKTICKGGGGTDFYPRAIEIVRKDSSSDPAPAPAPEPDTPEPEDKTPAQNNTQPAVTAPAAVPAAVINPIDAGLRMNISKRGKMTLRWGKVDGASGYDIYVRTDDGKSIFSKKTASVRSGRKLSKKIKRVRGKKVNPNKTYRFVVRAYKKTGRKKVYIATSSMCIRNGSGN